MFIILPVGTTAVNFQQAQTMPSAVSSGLQRTGKHSISCLGRPRTPKTPDASGAANYITTAEVPNRGRPGSDREAESVDPCGWPVATGSKAKRCLRLSLVVVISWLVGT